MSANGNGKSRDKSRDPFNGAGLTPGNPGNKGGGRPSNEFRETMQALIEQPKVRKALSKILGDPDHPQFSSLWAKAAAYAYGQPSQRVEHTGEDGGPIEFVTEARESFAGRMDRLVTRLGTNRISGLAN